MMYWYRAPTIASAYELMICSIMQHPQFETAPRNQKIKEMLNISCEITDISQGQIFVHPARTLSKKYLCTELLLYFAGDADINRFTEASKFWAKLYPEGYTGTVNSAYGNLLFNKIDEKMDCSQWEWAKNSLIKDKDSRQAIMHYNRPVHQYEGNGDFVCTLTSQFFIRNNKLHMTTNMRSMDLFFGFPYDIVFFTLMQQCMRLELLDSYPELQLGEYVHNVGSAHIYERNFEVFQKIVDDYLWRGSLELKERIEEFKRLHSENVPNPTRSLIKHPEILALHDDINYEPKDEFVKWLKENINDKTGKKS